MESVSNVVRVHLPNYLRDLPLPTSVFGWLQLSIGDWIRLLPFGTVVGGLSILAVQGLSNAPTIGPIIKVWNDTILMSAIIGLYPLQRTFTILITANVLYIAGQTKKGPGIQTESSQHLHQKRFG